MRGQAFVTFPSVELAQRALVSDYQLSSLACNIVRYRKIGE
jgi:hypothetical protein